MIGRCLCVPVFGLIVLAAVPAVGLQVTDLGAVPDDGRDDTAAFVEAFKQAQATRESRIVIPAGRYHLRADGNPERRNALLPVSHMKGLVVEGRGAELILSGVGRVFAFGECQDITVRGLTLDWERPPFSEGTVVATAPRHFDIRVLDSYPVQGGEPVGAFMTYHPDTRLPDGRDLDVYHSVERTELVAPQVLRVHLNREISVPVGKLLLLRHQVYAGGAFAFHRCRDVRVNDVTVHCTPGMALVCTVCTNVTLQKFNVMFRPGSQRLMTATADATHFGGCKGTILLEDCTFEGMGDDGVNVKSGLYLIVRRRVDDRTVLGQHNLKIADLPDAGDIMEMAHVDTLCPFASGKVRAAKMEPGEGNVHRVEFEGVLPAELREGDVLGNASRVPRLRIRRCTVRANRARGVLCQTRDAVIENCTFQYCTGPGVKVLTEVVYFFESIGTRNVTVRNNRFENCNLGAASAEAALCGLAYLKDFAYPPRPGVHRDLTIHGNRIIGTAESAIFCVAVDGLTVSNNTVEQACLRGARENGKYAIRIQDCARVTVQDNIIDPARQGPAMIESVRITPTD
ncbi:MAG TPA: right-handed parallel beta-helix repeat-containing protein [Phycisphaerae bacterium]|nr:right-handed parallel beta-helix repeat-containing protein [Phycisphaerae bacterium]HON65989.1 right-handed parallel beta-helix repeat-containing protein [Phycisphaerae bacterium]HPZ98498.1 right-handed parallel beta-helix repeat-containing protein [Phycisphaerae bacterium]